MVLRVFKYSRSLFRIKVTYFKMQTIELLTTLLKWSLELVSCVRFAWLRGITAAGKRRRVLVTFRRSRGV